MAKTVRVDSALFCLSVLLLIAFPQIDQLIANLVHTATEGMPSVSIDTSGSITNPIALVFSGLITIVAGYQLTQLPTSFSTRTRVGVVVFIVVLYLLMVGVNHLNLGRWAPPHIQLYSTEALFPHFLSWVEKCTAHCQVVSSLTVVNFSLITLSQFNHWQRIKLNTVLFGIGSISLLVTQVNYLSEIIITAWFVYWINLVAKRLLK